MKIAGKEIFITRSQIKRAIAALSFLAVVAWAVYATFFGADPDANPVLDVIDKIDSAASLLPDTL